MRKLGLLAVAVAVLALTSSASAQQRQRGQRGQGQPPGFGGGFGGGPLFLLSQKSVQDELKLTEDQIKQVTDASKKQTEARQGLRDLDQDARQKKMQELNQDSEKAIATILKPDQAKRLNQISLQQQGYRALATPKVAKELGLTDDQLQKLRDISADVRTQMRDLFQGGGGGNREEAQKKIADLNKATTEKAMGVLTADQKTKWKEMTGEPFKGEIRPAGPARGRRDLSP
jgi:Spy/CpxP family protein refolding chaperone